jgi:hypothetical protein
MRFRGSTSLRDMIMGMSPFSYSRMLQFFDRLGRDWSWTVFFQRLRMVVVFILFAILIPSAQPASDDQNLKALGLARDHLFDFVKWEVDTVADKAANQLVAPQRYMTEAQKSQYVRDYLDLVDQIDKLEQKVSDIYVNPEITDPDAASADLRSQRDALRAEQQKRQALAEAIIQSQVQSVLVDYGFGVGGQVMPPMSIRFTQLPTILIISPRDHIERTGANPLEHGITVDQMEHLESSIDKDLGVSSLIVPLGGLAVYPAMLIETGSPASVFEIASHEWMHHYLAFFPLGFNYGTTSEIYTLNETVASLFGKEIGWAVLKRYYPDLAGDPPDYTPQPPEEPKQPEQKPEFDFRTEMRITRVTVDDLLAAGQIERSEAYMEARRRFFVDKGYHIRKLNQAYFAFYGSYADQPGATGSNPIGPALRDLRYYSGSLYQFILKVRGITTLNELKDQLKQSKQEP